MKRRVVVLFAALLTACGGREVSGVSDSGHPATEAGDVDAARGPVCPPSKPRRVPLARPADLRVRGRPSRILRHAHGVFRGVWTTTQTPATTGCSTTNSPACPTSFSALEQEEGCEANLDCFYAEARCSCATLLPGEPVTWLCDTGTNTAMNASGGASCPSPRPRIGIACTEPGTTCDYGWCQSEDDVLACVDGIWQAMPASKNGCPL